jgi:hypothetical protein
MRKLRNFNGENADRQPLISVEASVEANFLCDAKGSDEKQSKKIEISDFATTLDPKVFAKLSCANFKFIYNFDRFASSNVCAASSAGNTNFLLFCSKIILFLKYAYVMHTI